MSEEVPQASQLMPLLAAMEQSSPWRIGSRIVRLLDARARLVRRR